MEILGQRWNQVLLAVISVWQWSRTDHLHPGVLSPGRPLLLVLLLFPKGRETHVVALLPCLSVCLSVSCHGFDKMTRF